MQQQAKFYSKEKQPRNARNFLRRSVLNKARSYYLTSREEKEKWVTAIKNVIGYANMFDFYEIK